MTCRTQGDNRKTIMAAVIAGCLSMLVATYAAGAAPAAPAAPPTGAGARTTPNAAPNSGMIPNANSGMIPNTGAGAPTNPTAAPAAPMNPVNPNVNATNPANPANPNAVNPNTVNGTTNTVSPNGVANPAATTNGTAAVNWPAQDRYWRDHFSSQPYATSNATYGQYQPAYQFGVNLFNQSGGQQQFSSMDLNQLKQNWNQQRGNSNLTWEQAEPAVRDAYNRMQTEQPSGGVTPAATP